MRWTGCLVALPLALLAGLAVADSGGSVTTYRWVDAQGVVHYSDTPQPGAERLQIQPAQTFRDAGTPSGAGRGSARPTPQVYQTCQIAQPSSDQSFYSPESLVVSVQLSPLLRAGDQVSVTVDGGMLMPADDTGVSFQLASPERGSHTVEAVVRDAQNRIVCTAAPVTFYVQRPSLLAPHSPAEGHGAAPAGGH